MTKNAPAFIMERINAKGGRNVKALRITVIVLLTAAALLAILSPALLAGILPQNVIELMHMDEFPLLGTCTKIGSRLISAVRGGETVSFDIVTGAIGDSFWDEALSLMMVSVLTIPVSLLLGFVLYKPLYKGVIARGLLYVSLNLCSVLIAWIIYRQVYFRLLIEGLIQEHITDQTLQNAVNYLTQFFSVAAIGALGVKIAVAFLAARVMVHRIILPMVGTVIRTALFAFLTALMMLWQADPAQWSVILPIMLVTLLVCGLSDGLFGS